MMSSSDPSSPALSGSGTDASPIQNISALYTRAQRQYQQILDRWTPYMLYRWLSTAGLLAVFLLRIVLAQGVSYSLSLLALFLLILKFSQWYIGLSLACKFYQLLTRLSFVDSSMLYVPFFSFPFVF